jgi:hypothetical protein
MTSIRKTYIHTTVEERVSGKTETLHLSMTLGHAKTVTTIILRLEVPLMVLPNTVDPAREYHGNAC